ncbi:YbdD/YjiX family protein [Antribacter gilvus]|uniref:YbdD/YjiX family protein n=1 Tax=Antribacter gilvus TaxID=2304675 RepID=UPI000F7B4C50|nr:YbdD/YjiX family protein [Antribacter gilvus]
MSPGRAWRALTWYVKGVLGENDYERYVAHLRRAHPGAPVPDVGEYWRTRYAEQDAHPGVRCC